MTPMLSEWKTALAMIAAAFALFVASLQVVARGSAPANAADSAAGATRDADAPPISNDIDELQQLG